MLKHIVWPLLFAGALLAVSMSACHASTISPRRLLEVADIVNPTLSPDGRSVAFRVVRASVARNTYDTVWYVQGLDDQWPRRIADGGVPLCDTAGDSSPCKVVWSADGRWVYYRALINGRVDVWRAAADGSGAEPMTHDAADVRDFTLGESGRFLRYSVGATREEVRSVERAEYDRGIHIDASAPIGQPLFRSGYVRGRLATQHFGKVWFVSAIQWRPDHDEVLFTVTDPRLGLAQSIFRWNVGTGKVRAVVKTAGLVNGGRDPASGCGVSAEVLVCVTAGANQPPRLERIDLESGKRHVLFDPNAALARDMAKVPVRLLRWKDEQGRWFTGQFYPARRSGGGPTPLFITYYRCPGFVRGGVGDEWPLVSLAQAGISALCINHPPGYIMDAVARYGEGLAAVESVVDLLSKKGEIDRTRVGMGGLSFGGEVTMWTVTHSSMLAAASVASSVVSPLYYLMSSMKGEAFLKSLRMDWGLGSPSETPERWKVLSPVFQLDRVHAPILLQQSEQEYMYALDYAIPLIREHRADLYVFPNEPHQKFQPRHKLAVYERNLDWFRFWLQGYEDPAPSKRAQYMRWRVIREHTKQRPTGL